MTLAAAIENPLSASGYQFHYYAFLLIPDCADQCCFTGVLREPAKRAVLPNISPYRLVRWQFGWQIHAPRRRNVVSD
jgi:hypothetical protein